MKPRVLLVGCHGRLGQHLLRRLLGEAQVLGLDMAQSSFVVHPDFEYARLEGTSRKALKPHFTGFRPQAVINAAAYTNVDLAEKEKEACWRSNVDLVRALADSCRPARIWLGQVSTDYVFDGHDGPYAESDRPSAEGVYARSKLAAENLLKGEDFPIAIFRTIVLFGKGHGLKPDFFQWAESELRAGREINIVTDQLGNCCWAGDLAKAIRQALYHVRKGLFHVAAHGHVSRFEMACMMADQLGLDKSLIKPILTAGLNQAAPRPLTSGLKVEWTERELDIRFPDIATSLAAWAADRAELWSIN